MIIEKSKKHIISLFVSIIAVCLCFLCVHFGISYSNEAKAINGGAIYLKNNTSYTMKGGSIENKTGDNGGAVYVGNGATFTMTGGIISGCTATNGGAIYIASGGKCYLKVGQIHNCSATNEGWAIYVEEGGYLEISEGFIISGCGVNYLVSIKAINQMNVRRPVTIIPYVNGIEQTQIKTFSNEILSSVGLPNHEGCGWYEEDSYQNKVSTNNIVGIYSIYDIFYLYIPDHIWEITILKGSTCQEDGGYVQTCQRSTCKETQTFETGGEYGDHNYECIESFAGYDCTSDGLNVYECTICLNTYNEGNGIYGAHDYQLVDVWPGTCIESGQNDYECIICFDRYLEDNGVYGDHNYLFAGSSAGEDCQTEGVDTYECSYCGDTYDESNGEYGDHYDNGSGFCVYCGEACYALLPNNNLTSRYEIQIKSSMPVPYKKETAYIDESQKDKNLSKE